MGDFCFLLNRLDDTPDQYRYGTINRGTCVIDRPYLALLANKTPDNIRPFARQNSSLWGDGFLARFALICPPEEQERRRDPFPKGHRQIPEEILSPLNQWNDRLTEAKSMRKTVQVRVAYEAYDNGLLDLLEDSKNNDLDGNYARLPEKALTCPPKN
jgi:hypothetical protein